MYQELTLIDLGIGFVTELVGGRDGCKQCLEQAQLEERDAAARHLLDSGTVLNLRITTSQNCEAVPRRARIQGS